MIAESQSQHLRGLNPEQRAAVQHVNGPLLILAGAGTGKTKTLVHRIAHLIRAADVEPQHIVGVTFTNRAADEMRERVQSYIGDDARKVTLCTFHALGLRVLREHGTLIGMPRRFAVYAAADQLAALKMACAEISVGNDVFDHKRVMRQISSWKNHRVDPAQATELVKEATATGTRADEYAVLAADAYHKYEEILRACGAVDFDDLLLLPLKLLSEHEEVRRAVWKRWHHVMIDEYQDTNGVQFELARLLAGTRRNLCVVGDDDQSIYAFRGAEVGNILEFETHFPGAKVVRLEENYRSTRRIIAAANAVIAANPLRHDKKLRTSNAVGAELDYFEHEDEGIEADVVAREVATRRLTQKLKWGDFAVLFRMNTQARALEEALRARNVPYKVVGATSFFERKEVGDAIAYLRSVVYPLDEIALRRILNYPQRGIGRTTIMKVAEQARTSGQSFLETLRAHATGSAQQGVTQLLTLLQQARSDLHLAEMQAAASAPRPEEITPIAAWAKALIEKSGIEAAIRDDPRNAKSAGQRVDNLRDLVGTIIRYERKVWNAQLTDGEWAPPTLAGALSVLALDDLNEEDEEPRTDDHRVTLMTLHSAKGLEFKHVFIVGLEEGILPHSRSLDENQLAEERRLMYVGITRARDRLSLSYCRQRKRGGSLLDVLPSRFIEEIPAELLIRKSAETKLAPEESVELRKNFFANMKAMLEE
ncbi:MAG TPA: UvrD-helicase domain-containing protein [Longimicrobiales bacterium]|nr:UvrD-helicase domain-containing protein [Longimicrobiales bacterium]